MNVHTLKNPTVYDLYSALARLIDGGHGAKTVIVAAGRKKFTIVQVATRPNSEAAPVEIDTRET
jgi:hypothetical protein